MLNAYLTSVQTLLHDLNAQFYTTTSLTTFINAAREQIAMEGECIRGESAFATVANGNVYDTANVTVPIFPTGIQSLLSIRSISYNNIVLESRPWDYFNFYFLNLAAPPPGPPVAWCPQMQGIYGTFFIAPESDKPYNVSIDGIWVGEALTSDSTPEAIPYPWTDAVQFYAAYLALLESQRQSDADGMYKLYELYMTRARSGVTPLVDGKTSPGGLASRQLPGQAPADGPLPTKAG